MAACATAPGLSWQALRGPLQETLWAASQLTLWLDDDHSSSEDERPLASLTWITSSPEFSTPSPPDRRYPRCQSLPAKEATCTSCTSCERGHGEKSGSRDARKDDVQMSDDDVQLVKVIPPVVDLLTPPRKARPPASPLRSDRVAYVGSRSQDAGAKQEMQVKTEVITAKRAPVKAEVVTPKRGSRLQVKTEVFTPKRVLRVRREVGLKPSGKRHPLHPLSPNRSCLRGFVQARACHLNLGDVFGGNSCFSILNVHPFVQSIFTILFLVPLRIPEEKQREQLSSLFATAGWPRRGDGSTREAIAELLGLSKASPRATTYLAWATRRDAMQAKHLLAAAILSVYKYRGKRRCGCLEFIVSRSRGFGSRLLHLAQRFLKAQNISRLFSGVDLSQPYAMAAHNSWGFRRVTQQDWEEAGLATYSQGDVCYMVLDLDRSDMEELFWEPNWNTLGPMEDVKEKGDINRLGRKREKVGKDDFGFGVILNRAPAMRSKKSAEAEAGSDDEGALGQSRKARAQRRRRQRKLLAIQNGEAAGNGEMVMSLAGSHCQRYSQAERQLLAAGAAGSEPRQRRALDGARVAFDQYLDDLKQLNLTATLGLLGRWRPSKQEELAPAMPKELNRSLRLSNGLEMPRLGLGTTMLNGKKGKEAIVQALHMGYRLIDTAQAYENEAEVGQAWQLSKLPREEIFIATKLSDDRSCKRKKAKALVSLQLQKLKTSYIDQYMLHGPCPGMLGAWKDLEELYDEGVLRSLGVSNFNYDDLIRFNAKVRVKPHVVQNKFSIYHRGWAPVEKLDVAQKLQDEGVVVMGFCNLDAYPHVLQPMEDVHVKRIAQRHGHSAAQVLLRHALQHGTATVAADFGELLVVIPKSQRADRLRETLGQGGFRAQVRNADIFDFELSEAEMRFLDALPLLAYHFDRPAVEDLFSSDLGLSVEAPPSKRPALEDATPAENTLALVDGAEKSAKGRAKQGRKKRRTLQAAQGIRPPGIAVESQRQETEERLQDKERDLADKIAHIKCLHNDIGDQEGKIKNLQQEVEQFRNNNLELDRAIVELRFANERRLSQLQADKERDAQTIQQLSADLEQLERDKAAGDSAVRQEKAEMKRREQAYREETEKKHLASESCIPYIKKTLPDGIQ
eukprot:s1202_g3.t1